MIVFMNELGRDKDRDREPLEPRRFETTRWSTVLAAREGATDRGSRGTRGALRGRTGIRSMRSFAARATSRGRAGPGSGLFREAAGKGRPRRCPARAGEVPVFPDGLLLHFLSNQADHDRAKKRGGGRSPISIDRLAAEGRYGREPAHNLTAERLFERQWALAPLDNVLETIPVEMIWAGKAASSRHCGPRSGGGQADPLPPDRRRSGTRRGSRPRRRHRLRRRYRELLREEVARTSTTRPTWTRKSVRSSAPSAIDERERCARCAT